jgi:ethanolamine utilization protein EutQ
MGKRLITQEDIRKAAEAGQKIVDAPPEACIITPMARDEAQALGISFAKGVGAEAPNPEKPAGKGAPPAETVAAQVSAILKDRLPSGVQPAQLERVVREVVAARFAASASLPPNRSGRADCTVGGVCLIDCRSLLPAQARPAGGAEKAIVAEAVFQDRENRLAGGYMRWEKTSFNRTVDRPEIGVVIEGELQVTVEGKTLIGRPGDMIYLPAGTAAVYSAPSGVLLACISWKR